MAHVGELLPGRVIRESEDFHVGRDDNSCLSVLHEIEYRGLLATRHTNGRGGVGGGLSASAWSGAASVGLGHGDLLNNVTVFNIEGEGGICKANAASRYFTCQRVSEGSIFLSSANNSVLLAGRSFPCTKTVPLS